MQARYYDPVIGRFYSNDPVDTVSHLFTPNGIQGFNRYAYANNNPYKYIDPDGKTAHIAYRGGLMIGNAINAGVRAVAGRTLSRMIADVAWDIMHNESSDSGVEIDDKVRDQLGDRGWTEEEINDLVDSTELTGQSTDNRGADKTEDGKGRNDPASVYGSKNGGHVVVNDNTNEVTHVSDKNDPNWIPDSRIEWKEDNR
ncbi:colicin E5-related ribonuclease [Thalassotalea agarivorans]|uniref:RHS repeat-associated core domain-containing protein n=1 Tax=Thalassotalea agarivorans TaxID=349064 RepID=A0A1H9Y7K5_THASX|nr:colicin E5-related ribonuclease [Thalassotalea agarivorans]SES64345.1 RHS repeat-associated core domain-containing protein [Thalassotalea agarivorans]